MVMVTHHVEEIPVGFTHVLLLRDGRVVAAGPLAETLTAENLTEAFGAPITLTADDGRYAARARAGCDPLSRFRVGASRLIESILGALAPQTFTSLAKSRAHIPQRTPHED